MQTISSSQLCHEADARVKAHMRVVLGFVLVLGACLMAACFPAYAEAKSYTMPKVDIQSQVETDGSLHFTEQRIFDFDGDFTAVWWTFENLPEGASLEFNSVRMASADADGAVTGEWTVLPSEPFVLSWRDEGGPGVDAYSFDAPKNTLYVFFNATDERRIVELDYTVTNGVQAYKDVGEMYWRYIGSEWAEDSSNVTMTVALPVPQGTEVVPGENVRAWGHGPLDGSLSISADGIITYSVPRVASGQYAEARAVFPVEWLTNLSGDAALAYRDQMRLEKVLAEENAWADQANRDRVFSLAFVIAFGALCVLLILWALRAYFKYGKEHQPDFTDEYWRDVPDRSVHPAVIGRLWRWDRESQDDFSATLMHLAHVGAVRIDSGTYPEPGLFGPKEVADYYITRLPAANELSDPIDQMTLSILFNDIAEGRDALWFGTIKKYGEDHPQEFINAMEQWQGIVSAQTNAQDFFEAKGKRYQGYLIAAAVVVAVAGFVSGVLLENFIPIIFTIPTAIALGVIANYMPRRSVYGNNLVAKCKALRNWLRDFSSLDERPPTDVKVWGEFMVYAYLFGVAEQAIKQLQTTMPQLFEYDGSMGATYMPWWVWYSNGYSPTGAVMPSMGSILQTSLSNTMTTAQAALSGASGNFSSGGGFGGGFSGGGGGGFGGGGGGAR
ncbi:DUF2207 domain-containing protein [Eggerthella sp. YY7918]|uniref:DUF2207 domain-containing protein n=1 Tax=Eggerthella sp. (strain YY7918) TaxID=502558 RepID=UPI0002171116|nr:DUF2207 domain-containing protein [Eggerthella sp. YY7918]BAK45741.1 hypothetical protein EGYY_27460 [Eggerthella sp. YY7918]